MDFAQNNSNFQMKMENCSTLLVIKNMLEGKAEKIEPSPLYLYQDQNFG